MLVVGIAMLLFAALIQLFAMSVVAGACVTGIVMVALGLLLGERIAAR